MMPVQLGSAAILVAMGVLVLTGELFRLKFEAKCRLSVLWL